jgi:hypothetical protein
LDRITEARLSEVFERKKLSIGTLINRFLEREREKKRERDTERERQREIERDTERERQREIERDREIERQRERERECNHKCIKIVLL